MQTIVALGGGGFSTDLDDVRPDDYVLSLARRPHPRICFIPTASGDADSYITRFYTRFSCDGARPSHLSLFRRTVEDLEGHLLRQDIVYVGGGNTVNLLAVWRGHGLDEYLRQAWESGVVLCGVSAGALCWFEAGLTDSFGKDLRTFHNGLGFLPGSYCPHYDSEASRKTAFRQAVASGGLPPGIAADDSVILRFEGTGLCEAVSTSPSRLAWRVSLQDGSVLDEAIVPRSL